VSNKVPPPRRFEYVGDGSSKFWEISVHGAEVTVRFGRIGTNGQTAMKTLGDAAAAQKHTDMLIRQKTGKGYSEVSQAWHRQFRWLTTPCRPANH
jgi:predicted DNA-binding WGR domain protein